MLTLFFLWLFFSGSSQGVNAGTDMFWEMHDRHFPAHYMQDGRVTCSEEQAARELEGIGIEIEEE